MGRVVDGSCGGVVYHFAMTRIPPTQFRLPPLYLKELQDLAEIRKLPPNELAKELVMDGLGICMDCGEGIDEEIYMVHDELWNSVADRGYLCIGCLELRLGRELVPEDFKPNIVGHDFDWASPRLKDRLGKGKLSEGGQMVADVVRNLDGLSGGMVGKSGKVTYPAVYPSPEALAELERFCSPGQSLDDACTELIMSTLTDPGYEERERLVALGREFELAEARLLAAEEEGGDRGGVESGAVEGAQLRRKTVKADTEVPGGGIRGGWDAAAEIMPNGKPHPDDEWEKDTNWGDVVKQREARKDRKAAEPGRGGLRADD